jgi:hypothetical protein
LKKGIKIKYSANYYPQGNGLVESTNKNLLKIIKKTIFNNQRDWHKIRVYALWDDIITPKETLGNPPYFLIYGKESILPVTIALRPLQLAQSIKDDPCPKTQE